ncbi:MAG: tRNA (adenosine(37)-N6)-dimethylallyltransferase MiaA [Clostridia bacterium]|nr:tRNA (adenosine(37)-N6)-dimethylallyltransferase MiaA [Clostridia bacterium]
MLHPLIIIVGPTAVGKTAVGIELAKLIKGEIISGDSMQVYKYMDIGTAKPTMEERKGIPHHMIDILEPDEDYSVAVFQRNTEQLIPEIVGRGRLPILAGGTGLYVRSVTDRYNFTEFSVDQEYRMGLEQEAGEKGNQVLLDRLREVDPTTAARLHVNDLRRIIRALEVYHFTGQPISSYQDAHVNPEPKYNLAMFGLTMERQELYNRIDRRVDLMVEHGLVEEVRELLNRGYSPNLTSMQGLGYKEIVAFLEGQYDIDEAIRLLKRNTRHFAKRQLTWFRREQRIQWLNVEKCCNVAEIANEIAARIEG